MKRYKAGATVGLLLSLLIISIVFIAIIPTLKENNGNGLLLFGDSVDTKNIESHINQQVEQIEKIRKNNLKDLNNINQEY